MKRTNPVKMLGLWKRCSQGVCERCELSVETKYQRDVKWWITEGIPKAFGLLESFDD